MGQYIATDSLNQLTLADGWEEDLVGHLAQQCVVQLLCGHYSLAVQADVKDSQPTEVV